MSEEQLVNETEVKENLKKELTEEETAALFINQAHKQFSSLVHKLSDRKRQAAGRVLEAVLFEPLEEVQLFGKAEQELFAICQQVMYHKGVLLRDAMKQYELKKGEQTDGKETTLA